MKHALCQIDHLVVYAPTCLCGLYSHVACYVHAQSCGHPLETVHAALFHYYIITFIRHGGPSDAYNTRELRKFSTAVNNFISKTIIHVSPAASRAKSPGHYLWRLRFLDFNSTTIFYLNVLR